MIHPLVLSEFIDQLDDDTFGLGLDPKVAEAVYRHHLSGPADTHTGGTHFGNVTLRLYPTERMILVQVENLGERVLVYPDDRMARGAYEAMCDFLAKTKVTRVTLDVKIEEGDDPSKWNWSDLLEGSSFVGWERPR